MSEHSIFDKYIYNRPKKENRLKSLKRKFFKKSKPHLRKYNGELEKGKWVCLPSRTKFWPIGIGRTPKEAYEILMSLISKE